MNFLGKFLVLLILVLSISFMTFGLVVNRTHRDLKAEADRLREEVNQARQKYQDETRGLVIQHKQLDVQLRREETSALEQLRKLESEHVALGDGNEELQNELLQLKQQRADATGRVAALQANNNQLGEQVGGLRSDIDENVIGRQQAFDKSLTVTESLHQLQGQLEAAFERRRDLREDLGQDQER